MHNTEDKLWWCRLGEQKELEFVKKYPDLGFKIDKKDKYDIDLIAYNGLKTDLKYRAKPFFKSGSYGFDPQYTVTINTYDISRYMNKSDKDVLIVFWVSWEAQTGYGVSVKPLKGVWITSVACIHRRILREELPIHTYARRGGSDKNKTDSYLYDIRRCKKIA